MHAEAIAQQYQYRKYQQHHMQAVNIKHTWTLVLTIVIMHAAIGAIMQAAITTMHTMIITMPHAVITVLRL